MHATAEEEIWLDFALDLVRESGALLREASATRPDVEIKPDRSFVTALDARIEHRLRERITDRFPTHGIVGEEDGSESADADLVWVLDPIDGTAAFIAGLPVFGTLIALLRDGVPILGIIDHPITSDRWVGLTGRPTTHNMRRCRTRPCPDFSAAILSASNPDFFADHERAALDALRAATAWRIWGGACMSFGLLASGRTDAAFDTRLKLWDFAPFRPILEGAGGVITDWSGRPIDHATGSQIMAAGDPASHRVMLDLVETAMRRS